MLNSFSDLAVYLVEPSVAQARIITTLLAQQGVTRVAHFDNDASIDADIADLETLQVLIVDDSASARKFIRRVPKNLGISHFTEASNGVEATTILNDKMVDLVVTDYNMPAMDGKGLIDHIRTKSWQSSVPVLRVTSEQDAGRLAAVEEAGVSGICDKPFEPKTVKALLSVILQKQA